ncbi:MAG: SEL1-like repeat protein [Akkermansia sp.]|nr:SEL1-like repeat protein [Akkermansia sp.]
MNTITRTTVLLLGATAFLSCPAIADTLEPATYQQAFEWYKKAAEDGEFAAKQILTTTTEAWMLTECQVLVALGRLHLEKQENDKAFSLFRKAADMGDDRAMGSLGACYAMGVGVDKNPEQALYWTRKAAEAGNARAQLNMAVFYDKGEGVEQNLSEAARWVFAAAEQGLPDAMYSAGVCCYKGIGTLHSISKAEDWFSKAAAAGHADAAAELSKIRAERESADEYQRQMIQLQEYMDKQEYEKAFALILPFAEAGNAQAQYNVGIFYLKGMAMPQDTEKASEWFQKSAAQGYKDAEQVLKRLQETPADILLLQSMENFNNGNKAAAIDKLRQAAEMGNINAICSLAKCYHAGEGVEKNLEEAFRLFSKAAEAGESEAIRCMALCYYNGEGVEQNRQEAEKWMKKAAELGNREAINLLSRVEQDKQEQLLQEKLMQAAEYMDNKQYEKGIALFSELAEQGNTEAQYHLGYAYCRGIGVEKNPASAFKWFSSAAEKGDERAQCYLGKLYYTGYGVDEDREKAEFWLHRSAAQGNKPAQTVLQVIETMQHHENAQVREGLQYLLLDETEKAATCFRQAAGQGDAEACFRLGSCYYLGEGTEQNHEEALRWLKKAADLGHAEAQYNTAFFHIEGKIVPENLPEAERLLCAARGQGFEKADKALEQVVSVQKLRNQMFRGELHFEQGEYKKAMEFFLPVAEQGYANAQFNVAICLLSLSDAQEAIKWLKKAAVQGHAYAQYNLAICYYNGYGVEKNIDETFKWMHAAAAQGHEDATHFLNNEIPEPN